MNTKHENYEYMSNISFLPNGIPAPEVMTEEEVATFLRLDSDGTGANMTLKYYRDKGLIKELLDKCIGIAPY